MRVEYEPQGFPNPFSLEGPVEKNGASSFLLTGKFLADLIQVALPPFLCSTRGAEFCALRNMELLIWGYISLKVDEHLIFCVLSFTVS